MDLAKANQILRIAKMYYEEHLSQQEIAEIEEISKSTVSRMLKRAEDLGYIQINVVQPYFSTADLESALKKKFDLNKVTVIPDLIGNERTLIRDINKEVIKDLKKQVKDGDTVGVAWGNTMTRLSEDLEQLEPLNKKDVKVVQINGSASPLLNDLDVVNILRTLSRYFNASACQVCAPSFADTPETAQIIKNESSVKSVLDDAKNCDFALYSAGLAQQDDIIFKIGGLSESDIQELDNQHAIGDICSHFLKKNGEIASPEIDNRVIAVSLEELKNIPKKILVAYGEQKVDIIKTILENGLADRLFIDESLAKALLH